MDNINTYWTFFFMDAAGQRQPQTHPIAQPYFSANFSTPITPLLPSVSNSDNTTPIPHRQIQRTLHTQHELKAEGRRQKAEEPTLSPSQEGERMSQNPKSKIQNLKSPTEAETCLRCFISHGIDYACQQLFMNFGPNHGFTKQDLLIYALNDDRLLQNPKSKIQNPKSTYQSLSSTIFESFDPDASNLKTWTVRLVRQDKELNALLLDHGVYLASDWAILNATKIPPLQRILTDFHLLSPVEVKQAALLLESYHSIYRSDRLTSNIQGRCDLPSPKQLQRMQARFNALLERDPSLNLDLHGLN